MYGWCSIREAALRKAADPRLPVRDLHQLPGVARPGPGRRPLQPPGKFRPAADAADCGGTFELAAGRLGASFLLRLAGLRAGLLDRANLHDLRLAVPAHAAHCPLDGVEIRRRTGKKRTELRTGPL